MLAQRDSHLHHYISTPQCLISPSKEKQSQSNSTQTKSNHNVVLLRERGYS